MAGLLVLVCGAAVAAKTCQGPRERQPAAPWTCTTWASETSTARTAWATSALTRLRRVDGLDEPSREQVATFMGDLTAACSATPGGDLAEVAAAVYNIGKR